MSAAAVPGMIPGHLQIKKKRTPFFFFFSALALLIIFSYWGLGVLCFVSRDFIPSVAGLEFMAEIHLK